MAKPVDLKELAWVLGVVLVLGLILLWIQKPMSEGFANELQRCGVDQPPCDVGQKCVNGFCAATEPAPAKEKAPVPLLPDGGPAPYF